MNISWRVHDIRSSLSQDKLISAKVGSVKLSFHLVFSLSQISSEKLSFYQGFILSQIGSEKLSFFQVLSLSQIRVWHLDLDFDMVDGLWYIHDPNFGSLSWIWSFKEHLCPLSCDYGLWRIIEVPDWGLTFWFWFWHGNLSMVHPCS